MSRLTKAWRSHFPTSQPLPERSWREPDAKTGGYTVGMLGLKERKLMFHLAKDYLVGAGAVVDVGAFCGGSSRREQAAFPN